MIEATAAKIAAFDARLKAVALADEACRRLMKVPGVGPVAAGAVRALAGDVTRFANGRDFAAWLGLTPRQNSSGGKIRLGGIAKAGNRDLRALLVLGQMAVFRHAGAHGCPLGGGADQAPAAARGGGGDGRQDGAKSSGPCWRAARPIALAAPSRPAEALRSRECPEAAVLRRRGPCSGGDDEPDAPPGRGKTRKAKAASQRVSLIGSRSAEFIRARGLNKGRANRPNT